MTRQLRAAGFALLLAASLVAVPAATLGPTTGAPTTDSSGTLAGTGATGTGALASPAGDGSAASDADASATDGVLDGPNRVVDSPGRVVDGPNGSTARERSKLSSSLRTRLSGGDGTDSTTGTSNGSTIRTASDSTTGTTAGTTTRAADSTTATTTGAQRVAVVVVAAPGRGDDVARAARGLGGSVGTQYRDHVEVRLPLQAVEALADRPAVRHVREPATPTTLGTVSEGVERMRADEVHERGLTGENATIAVIDVRFDPNETKLRDQVVARKNFGSGTAFYNDTSGLHGTASAEAVADVAPNASIALVAIRTGSDFLDAVDWIENETEADAVTMSLGWQPTVGPLDGTDFVSERIEASVNRSDLVWTVAAGNSGEYYHPDAGQYVGKHWNGSYTGVQNSSIDDRGGDLLNFSVQQGYGTAVPIWDAGAGSTTDGGGRIVVSWNASWTEEQPYSVHLWGTNRSGTYHLGEQDPTNPYVGFDIGYNAPFDGYYLEVERHTATGKHTFDVFTSKKPGGNDALWFLEGDEYTTQRSILLPATSPDVLTVGAVDQSSDVLEGYSSRGPTVDGRQGIDVAAPTEVSVASDSGPFTGTSAATPHVGGLAALLAGANQSASDEWIRSRIERSGRSISGDGANQTPGIVQSEVGSGHVDAVSALRTETAPDYEVTSLDAPSEVPHDGTIAVNATVRNEGLSAGNQTVAYHFEGTERATRTDVELGPGNETTLNFTWSIDGAVGPDTYTHGVRTANATLNASIQLLEDPFLAVSNPSAPASGERTETVTANATVENVGDQPANQTVELRLGDDPIGTEGTDYAVLENETVTLDPGDAAHVSSTGAIPGDEPLGDTNLSVATADDVERLSFEVEDPGWIGGTVTDANGSPLSNATVDLDTATVTPAKTDANGTYQLADVPAEVTHALDVSARGYDRNASVNATVPADGTATANATLVQRARYVGVANLTARGTVDAGESFELSATATNFGARNWTTDVQFLRNGTMVANRTPTLNATENETLAFSTSIEHAGTHSLSIATPNETRATTVDVQSSGGASGGGGGLLALGGSGGSVDTGDGGEPDLSIASAAAETAAVAVGEPVSVEAAVRNDGDAEGSRALTLRADGTPVDSTTVAVDAGATATATLSATFDEPGRYELSVDGERAGTVEVGEPDGGDAGSSDGTDDGATADDAGSGDGAGGDGLPGFGALLALLLVAAGVARRSG